MKQPLLNLEEKMRYSKKFLFSIGAVILLLFESIFGYAVFASRNSNLTVWFGNLFIFLTIFSIIILLELLLLGLYTIKSYMKLTKF